MDETDVEFRVRVSLERFFSDERSRVYMSCRRGLAVRSLARRLRRAFGLPRALVLMSNGHLLPPDEPLSLLCPDDPVQVIPSSVIYRSSNGKEKSIQTDEDVESIVPSPEDTPPRVASPPLGVPQSERVDGPEEGAPRSERVYAPEKVAPRSERVHVPEEGAPPSLADMKQHALQILEGYSGPPMAGAARRRRRVRRRRAPRLASPAGELAELSELMDTDLDRPSRLAEDTTDPGAAGESAVCRAEEPRDSTDAAAAGVVRLESAAPRAARLVRSLSEHSCDPSAPATFASPRSILTGSL